MGHPQPLVLVVTLEKPQEVETQVAVEGLEVETVPVVRLPVAAETKLVVVAAETLPLAETQEVLRNLLRAVLAMEPMLEEEVHPTLEELLPEEAHPTLEEPLPEAHQLEVVMLEEPLQVVVLEKPVVVVKVVVVKVAVPKFNVRTVPQVMLEENEALAHITVVSIKTKRKTETRRMATSRPAATRKMELTRRGETKRNPMDKVPTDQTRKMAKKVMATKP